MPKDNSVTPATGAFGALSRVTLWDVRDTCATVLEGGARRDTASAFRFLEARMGVDLAATPGRPQDVRAIFDGASPAALGVGAGRLANVKSLVIRAVTRFGMRRTPLLEAVPLAPAWAALFADIGNDHDRRTLTRFAIWCALKGIAPGDVTSALLPDFQVALAEEPTIRKPEIARKRTIGAWNACARRVAGWPDIRLAWPRPAPYMLPLDAFPAGFQLAVADWIEVGTRDDPFDDDARYGRPLRPETIQGHVYMFRRLASALVRDGGVPIERIDGFEVFFEDDHHKAALRPFLGQSAGYVSNMAALLRSVMRTLPGISAEVRTRVDVLVRRLAPKDGQRMGRRNRDRLKQFEDPDAIARLMAFPEAHLARALKLANPRRRAKLVETALAASILTFTGLRVKNLRRIHLTRNIRRVGDRVRLSFADDEMKTWREHELELPPPTVRLLDLFLAEHRAALPGADGPWLFPGERGGPRSYSALRKTLKDALWIHAGLEMSPHLYRHVIAYIIAARGPEHLPAVSRMLGHSSIRRTYESYLGTEGPAVSRLIGKLLTAAMAEEAAKKAGPGRDTGGAARRSRCCGICK